MPVQLAPLPDNAEFQAQIKKAFNRFNMETPDGPVRTSSTQPLQHLQSPFCNDDETPKLQVRHEFAQVTEDQTVLQSRTCSEVQKLESSMAGGLPSHVSEA